MKKIFSIAFLLVLLSSIQTKAQTRLTDGTNTLTLEGGNTLQFNFKGHYFSNFIFTDASGNEHPLKTSRGIVNNTPAPVCRADQERVAYASYQKDIGVYICMAKYSPNVVYSEFNMYVDMPKPGATGKALNRRVEVKLVK